MSFLSENIDRAIVMTQFDLRGFSHIGRLKENNPKVMDAITSNLAAGAIGFGKEPRTAPTDVYADYDDSTFEDYLAMCKRFAAACGDDQKEAIQLIIQEILRQTDVMKTEVIAKKREPSPYLLPLEKTNRWGKAMLALVEAFNVKLVSVVVAA